MKIIRSWPMEIPENHPRIEDNAERCIIPPFDYSPLAQYGQNLIHLDWDVAVGRTELRQFAAKCILEPDIIRVAPACTYPSRMWGNRPWHGGTHTIWSVWRWEKGQRIELKPGDPYCHLFGFSLVYLPTIYLQMYVKLNPGYTSISDIAFSQWYHDNTDRDVPVEWGTNVVHVNYSIKDVLTGPN